MQKRQTFSSILLQRFWQLYFVVRDYVIVNFVFTSRCEKSGRIANFLADLHATISNGALLHLLCC